MAQRAASVARFDVAGHQRNRRFWPRGLGNLDRIWPIALLRAEIELQRPALEQGIRAAVIACLVTFGSGERHATMPRWMPSCRCTTCRSS